MLTDDARHQLLLAVKALFEDGWMPHPLRMDDKGKPKVPIVDGWPKLAHDLPTLRALPWGQMQGIGLVCGTPSGGRCAIDIDDNAMGEAAHQLFAAAGVQTRLHRTVSGNLHVVLQETNASHSEALWVRWQGKRVKVELKTNGTQIATPPTPGYALLMDAPPMTVPTVREAWHSIERRLGAVEEHEGKGGAGYPSPWRPAVPVGERNMAAYIEAHKLREAGIPLEDAMEMMALRVERKYADGADIAAIIRTVRSAYTKGVPNAAGIEEADELHLLL